MRRQASAAAAAVLLVLVACSPSSEEITKKGIPYVDTGVDPGSWALVPAGEFHRGMHAAETMAVSIVTPADGPSLGMAPSGM